MSRTTAQVSFLDEIIVDSSPAAAGALHGDRTGHRPPRDHRNQP